MKRFFLYILCLLAAAGALAAGPAGRSFINIDSRDGLAQNNVKSIAQDRLGFIWLGTKNGLCRYDGRQVQTFRVQDPSDGAANQNVSALACGQDGRLWVGTDEHVFLFDAHTERFNHVGQAAQDGQAMQNWVADIKPDAKGQVWIIIPDEGVFRASADGTQLHHYQTPNATRGEHFSTLCITADGEVWASGWNIGLWRLDVQKDQFVQVTTDAAGRSLLPLKTNTICDYKGAIIMAAQDGHLLSYDRQTRLLSAASAVDFSRTIVRGATAFGDDLLVGTYEGLFILNAEGQQHFRHDLNDAASLADDIVYTTFRDREGGTWVGTMFGGVSYLPSRPLMFSTITHDTSGHHLSSDRIRELTLMGNDLYVGTDDHGLNRIHLSTGLIESGFASLPTVADDITLCLQPHGGLLYQSINKTGIKVIHPSAGTATLLGNQQLNLPEVCTVYDLLFDRRGRAWLATDWGVWMSPTGQLTDSRPVEGIREFWVYDLLEDRQGNIWAASMGSGLFSISNQGQVKHFVHDPADSTSLSSNSISSLFEDSRGIIWASTDRGGLCACNPSTGHFRRYSTQQGLPDDCAYAVLEDSTHHLWFGTNRGLVRLQPETGQVRVFTTRHGLPGNQFNYKSALAAPDGTLYFGTTNGLVACTVPTCPDAVEAATQEVPLYITRLCIGGVEVTPTTAHSPLKASIIETESITLPSNHGALTLDVALLSYAAAKTTAYAYRLEPVDRDWTASRDGAPVAFANLAPGDYTLHLRATTLDDNSQTLHERQLRITVLPPWWRSWWAILCYIALATAIALLWFWWYRQHKEAQFRERQRLFAIEKDRELNQNKVQFFTEIAHEIRTPLTLISGPLDAIQQKASTEPSLPQTFLQKHLTVIQQNTSRLLDLAGQLLDFQKLGAGKLTPQFERVDVSALLTATLDRFEPTFSMRGKQLLRGHIQPDVTAVMDREAVTKILSNLINNALKYGQTQCEATLTSADGRLRIGVFSDGVPIPAERREAIFNPFEQLRNGQDHVGGVGIGLTLCRSLAAMHQGTLSVEEHARGNLFILELPLQQEGAATETTLPPTEIPATTATAATPSHAARQQSAPPQAAEQQQLAEGVDDAAVRGATILVVDDEDGIRTFIADRLREDFIVETAKDGQEALEMLHSQRIDLVLTDVMMPVMDGVELCQHIKQDSELSHVPVILLTAKNDLETKIQGLRMGAEAYIEKPFAWDYLHQQVISLLSNRQKEREAFAKRPFFPLTGMQMSQENEAFMQKAMDVINRHLSDEGFNVEAMADELCMSRSSLLRKIKALFDMPPLEFIRLIRLKRAAELIQEGRYRVGEISQKVGFSSHSYFSKLFARQFGMTPKDFEQQLEEQRSKVKDLRQ